MAASERAQLLAKRRERRREREGGSSSDTPPSDARPSDARPGDTPPLAKEEPRVPRAPRSKRFREEVAAPGPAPTETGKKRARRGYSGPAPTRTPVSFDPVSINADAAKVVRRLTEAGFEAYLVGGCVRDLLVGHRPKDFDVATSARPEEVRALFRNSRIIGRRFRLVHVLYGGGHIIETATFRKNPPPSSAGDSEDLLIRSDNVFGEAHEDALRRDFTINALFYDLEDGTVLDWVGGMDHIQDRVVHTIGDPWVRFQEDPVRILRAIKFAARLDFGISPEVYDAIVQCRGALAMAARPRLSEEVLRLMRGGASHRSFWLAWETGVLDLLLPELSSFLTDNVEDETVWRMLREIDKRTKEGGQPLDDVLLWTTLLLEPLLEICDGSRDRVRTASDFLEPIVERLNLPRRISDAIRRIVALLPKVMAGRVERTKKSPFLAITEEVAEIRTVGLAGRKATFSVSRGGDDGAEEEEGDDLEKKKRRRRRRRK